MFWRIASWNISAAMFIPKLSYVNYRRPTCMANVVMYLDSSAISSWLYPWLRSSLLKTTAPFRSLTSTVMVGVACLLCCMALLQALMSTHTLIFRFFLGVYIIHYWWDPGGGSKWPFSHSVLHLWPADLLTWKGNLCTGLTDWSICTSRVTLQSLRLYHLDMDPVSPKVWIRAVGLLISWLQLADHRCIKHVYWTRIEVMF